MCYIPTNVHYQQCFVETLLLAIVFQCIDAYTLVTNVIKTKYELLTPQLMSATISDCHYGTVDVASQVRSIC